MVAVTGASGHVGANLVRMLLQRGETVRVLLHGPSASLADLEIERVQGDILDTDSLAQLFAGCAVGYHLAALISITGSQNGRVEQLNVQGAANAAKAAREAGVGRYVHVSSIHAFAHAPEAAVNETTARADAEAPPYDRSKAEGERMVQREVGLGLPAVVVNPTGVIGPADFGPSRMGQTVLAMARGRLPGVVNGGFNWVDVRDVCQSVLAAAEKGRVGEGYILGGRWASMAEVGQIVAAAAGRSPPPFAAPRWLAEWSAPLAQWAQTAMGVEPLFTPEGLYCLYQGSRHVSIAKAEAELGHTPRPLEDTLADTVQWFRDQGKLG